MSIEESHEMAKCQFSSMYGYCNTDKENKMIKKCSTCKYSEKKFTEEPCSCCDSNYSQYKNEKHTDYLETSKTMEELFNDKFPIITLLRSRAMCYEAIGYLECLVEFFPTYEKWARDKQTRLRKVIAIDIMMNTLHE